MTYLGRSVEQSFFFGASAEIKARAKVLRKRMTFCEKVLWQELRKRRNVRKVSKQIDDEVKKRLK